MNGSDKITRILVQKYGFLVGGQQLSKLLAYPSQEAFRQAEFRGTLPIQVFSIPHRKGKFAFTPNIATWMNNMKGTEEELQHEAFAD